MEEVLKIINPMSSTLFWTVVIFVVLIVVLWRFAFKPIGNMISKRQSEIKENIDSAHRQNEEAQKYLEDQRKELEKARKDAKKIVEESKAAAQKIKEEIEQQANDRSRTMVEDALAEIKNEKERSINEVKNEMVDIALFASEKMISKKLSEEEHKKIIEKSLKDIRKV